MLEMITAIYGFLCWLCFKKLRIIPVNDYTVVTAVLIPIALYGFGFLFLNMKAPVAKDVRLTAPVTPIVALVEGTVIEVPVRPNVALRKGDVLLRIDDTLYQARLEKAQAQLDLAKIRYEQTKTLEARGAGTKFDRQEAEFELARLQAEVNEAEFNVKNCTIVAPADGMVTQLVIRPGQFVKPIAFNQLLMFVHNEQAWVGSFPQQALQGMRDAEQAEIAITAAPGHVFSAKVMSVVPALAEGIVTAGQAIKGAYDRPPGRVLVMMKITDERAESLTLPIGTDAVATIYTTDSEVLQLVRGLIMRIKSWEAWIFN